MKLKTLNKNILRLQITCLFVLSVLVANNGYAQKANFEQAELFTAQMMEKMVGSTSVDPNWIEGKDQFWYVYENSDGKRWMFVDANRKSKEELFDREEMAANLTEIFNKPFKSEDLPINNLQYNTGKGFFEFSVEDTRFTYRMSDKKLMKDEDHTRAPGWALYSPDRTWIAFARDHNLYLMKAGDPDSTEYQLTDDGERWYSFQANDADTSSNKRLAPNANWFNDSKKLYTKRTDSRKIKDMWIVNTLKQRPELMTYKQPMPGDKDIYQDEAWVFDVNSKKAVKLDTDTDEWDDQALGILLTGGGFYKSDDSDYLYILRHNREWNKLEILKADTETGETEILFSEVSKPFFNIFFTKFFPINNNSEFIWYSDRTGWGQLYLLNEDGKVKNRITNGFYTVGDILKVDADNRTIFFEAFGKEENVNPYYKMVYSVNFDGSNMKRLTPEDAHHNISFSENGTYFVDNYSTVNQPTVSVLRDGAGNVIQELEKTDISKLQAMGWKAPEIFKVKAADGDTDLYGTMWKPNDFDSTKSYPLISDVYPGPNGEPIPRNFRISGFEGNNTAMAQLGFVVIAMGQRGGSYFRSKEYLSYGYDNFRDFPLADNKYGLEQLAARHSFIDKNRIGIYGHSGGGNMSTGAILTYPDFYKVAVSSAGNHDPNMYWYPFIELTNEVEKSVEPNTKLAENLKGNLLLVHGTLDDNVHPGHSFRMADALIKAEKRFDMMMLPGEGHYIHTLPYWERIIWNYFAEHLLGYKAESADLNIRNYEN
ncbi:DPP IV N-terminal domain-containing protein [Gracilimonas sp. Q87]|uniref:S9 family peptidase n=1 Tax=Gracilimonas sp. Q87 TaxID=3384766 RepID=UPI0039843BE4